MHYQLLSNEIKWIRFSFKRVCYHFFLNLLWDFRHIINMFPGIFAIRDAELELEIRGLYQIILIIMPFDHPELFNRFVSHHEGDQCGDLSQLEEHWSKLVLHGAVFVLVLDFYFLFFVITNRVFNFVKRGIRVGVPQSELYKLNFINIRW